MEEFDIDPKDVGLINAESHKCWQRSFNPSIWFVKRTVVLILDQAFQQFCLVALQKVWYIIDISPQTKNK